jgi:hypothetical protein
MALRVGRPAQRELAVLCALDLRLVPFAEARYAARLGPHPQPANVAWVGWAPPLEGAPGFAALVRRIPGFVPAFASDDFLLQYRAAELGLGAIFLGRMKHRLSHSPLVEIRVAGIPEIPSSLHLVCANTALGVPRIRAVADLLITELKAADTS